MPHTNDRFPCVPKRDKGLFKYDLLISQDREFRRTLSSLEVGGAGEGGEE